MEAKSVVTLRTLTGLAAILHRLRIVSGSTAVVAAVWFVVVVLSPASGSTQALGALSVLLWAGLALAMGQLLSRPPPLMRSDDAWMRRLRIRLLRLAYWQVALSLFALAGLALVVSYRALRLAFG